MRILIADDHAATRVSLCDDLREAGFEVCGDAATGSEAVDQAVSHRPDLCLIDVVMPEGGGIFATRQIKRALPETKIVLVTATPDQDGAVAAARAGADGYLSKDVDRLRLPKIIHAVAAGESAYPRRLLAQLLTGLVGDGEAL